MKKIFAALSLVLVFATSVVAAPVTIDFLALPAGPVTTIGDATFALSGPGPAVGAVPYNNSNVTAAYGLTNSPNGFYPTNTTLSVTFTGPVTGVQFNFNPYGLHGQAPQGYTLYDSSNNVITSGLYSSSGFASYNLSAYTGVARIEWSNGTGGTLGNQGNWIQGLELLTFELQAVPEPASMLAWGLIVGVGAVGYRLRKRQPDASA